VVADAARMNRYSANDAGVSDTCDVELDRKQKLVVHEQLAAADDEQVEWW
jgi:hypothetical protein